MQAILTLHRIAVDDIGEERVVQLVGQLLRELGQAQADRVHGYRGRVQHRPDDDRVRRVVQLGGPVQDEHIHAEPCDLAESRSPKETGSEMKSRERAIRVPREQTKREDPHGCDRGHERDEPVAGAQYTEVHHRDNDAGADAGRVVEIVPLESVHDRSEDGERKAHAEVHADDQQYVSRSTHLIGLDVEEQIDARGNERRHDEAQDAESGEHHADRAEDLVQRRAVAPGAVLCDEPHQRAAIPEVEHAEIPGHRRRESPQSVRRAAEVRHVERQHHEADDAVDEDHEIACADVSRDEFERAVRGSPNVRVRRIVHGSRGALQQGQCPSVRISNPHVSQRIHAFASCSAARRLLLATRNRRAKSCCWPRLCGCSGDGPETSSTVERHFQ